MNLQFKTLTTGLAALLLMSGIFTNQALAGAIAKPVITSANTKSCVMGLFCSYQITATNSPTSYGATPRPAGMSLVGNVLSGYPTTIGTTIVTVSATNAGGAGTLAVTFSIIPSPARVVVAPSGGNYTTITAALAGINPTAGNPCVIEVWPGVYTEPATVDLKSYVHLKGSGRDVTAIQTSLGQTADVISAIGLTNVTISGLTITGGKYGISTASTATNSNSITISDNTISNSWTHGIAANKGDRWGSFTNSALITGNIIIDNGDSGIDLTWTSATISRNHISRSGSRRDSCGSSTCQAIFISSGGAETQIITDNVITGNKGVGIYACNYTNATISNNIITDNARGGIDFSYDVSTGTVTNNRIINNGSLFADIMIKPTSTSLPNISFNVFNSISGTAGVGSYNVNSNGDPILVP